MFEQLIFNTNYLRKRLKFIQVYACFVINYAYRSWSKQSMKTVSMYVAPLAEVVILYFGLSVSGKILPPSVTVCNPLKAFVSHTTVVNNTHGKV